MIVGCAMGEAKRRRDFMQKRYLDDTSWCPYDSYQITVAVSVTEGLGGDRSDTEKLVRVMAAMLYDRDGPLPEGRAGRCIAIAAGPIFMDIDESTRQITVAPVVLRAPTAPPLAFSQGLPQMPVTPATVPTGDLAGMKMPDGTVIRSFEPGKTIVTGTDSVALGVQFGANFAKLGMPPEETMELIGNIQQSQAGEIELGPGGTSTIVIKLTPRGDMPEGYEYAKLFEEELALVTDINEKTLSFGFMSDFFKAPTQ